MCLITFIDMNDTFQAPYRGEVESPTRRQGSSTVGTLIFAGWYRISYLRQGGASDYVRA